MHLKDKLEEYKLFTLEAINIADNKDLPTNEVFEKLYEIISKRQKVIDSISGLIYTTDEFKKICKAVNLMESELKLKEVMENNKQLIKKEMNNLKKSKKAHKAYNNNFLNNSLYVKGKI